MDVAGAWYASGTFWAGAGVVVALLAAVAVVWVTLTVGFPRRRLYYRLRAAAPLLTAPAGMRSDLELLHHGTPLADPRVLTVELVSRGRKDIPSDAYNDRQPLQLDVGCRIVEILQVASEPGTLPAPEITPDGTLLKIGPSLIGRRQEITINVLADGGMPALSCLSSLIDVQVRQRTDELPKLTQWAVAAVVTAAGVAAGVAVAAVVTAAGVAAGVAAAAVVTGAGVEAAAAVTVAVVWARMARRR